MTDKRAKLDFLDTLFSTRRAYTVEDIVARFEKEFGKPLSRRSFFNYIKELRAQEAPLTYKIENTAFGNQTFYCYEEAFSTTKKSLNSYDTKKIKAALTILQQLEHLPQMQDLSEIILKLEQKTVPAPSNDLPIIFFEHKPAHAGMHWLRPLYSTILEKKVIRLTYEPFANDLDDLSRWTETGTEILVHPYFLKESKNRWHLFGFNQTKNKIENYALDRIKSVEIAPNIFYKPSTVDFSVYFNDIVGVTKFEEKPVELFELKVSPLMSAHWLNRPLHSSQTLLEETPQYSLFSFQLRWNYEWQNLILSYSAHTEVQKPAWFRDGVQGILRAAVGVYG